MGSVESPRVTRMSIVGPARSKRALSSARRADDRDMARRHTATFRTFIYRLWMRKGQGRVAEAIARKRIRPSLTAFKQSAFRLPCPLRARLQYHRSGQIHDIHKSRPLFNQIHRAPKKPYRRQRNESSDAPDAAFIAELSMKKSTGLARVFIAIFLSVPLV